MVDKSRMELRAEGLGKSVGDHLCGRYVWGCYLFVLHLLSNVVVLNIDIFAALMELGVLP